MEKPGSSEQDPTGDQRRMSPGRRADTTRAGLFAPGTSSDLCPGGCDVVGRAAFGRQAALSLRCSHTLASHVGAVAAALSGASSVTGR